MSDNVRVGRESITKKISYHDKISRPYKTIESLEKEPTKKKIILNDYRLKKESQTALSNSSQVVRQERRIKSLGKYDIGKITKTSKNKSGTGVQIQMSTIEGLLNHNMQMIKFSVARERDRLTAKQKYKRSQQVRSLLQNKKMSSITKLQHKDTGSKRKFISIYQSNDTQSNNKLAKSPHSNFKDLNLESIINPVSEKQQEITLEDVFEQGCSLFFNYLANKQQKIATFEGQSTFLLKSIKDELGIVLDNAMTKFSVILKEVGELSIKNLVMIALVSYEQGKYNDTIMYLVKALQKTEGNLFQLKLPSATTASFRKINYNSKEQQLSNDKKLQLALTAYLYLAQSYKLTNNFLCAINTLRKCEAQMQSQVEHQKTSIDMKMHYQTLLSKQMEEERAQTKQQMRLKKKSYLLSVLQPENTANKFKKYSHTHNLTSVQLNKSNSNLEASQRNKYENIKNQDIMKQSKGTILTKDSSNQQYFKHYKKQLVSIYLLLARLYTKTKSYDLAIEKYRKCLQINFRSVEALIELASIYYLKYNSKKSLQWLQNCLYNLQKQQIKDKKLEIDIGYINYHKCLILLQQKRWDQSYALFSKLHIQELSSEVNYYKGLIKLRKLNEENTLRPQQKNRQIQQILIYFSQGISAFTSKQYLVKSYFSIILILVFEKKDYYGAQYEVARFKKLISSKIEQTVKEQSHIQFSRISKIYEEEGLQKEQNRQSKQWNKQSYINILFDIIDGVIYILKMKIAKGISIFKQISLKMQTYSEEIYRHYGSYYKQIIILLYQFKFYGYYILREYELALKHVNKLIEIMQNQQTNQKQIKIQINNSSIAQLKFININRLMLQCMILMRQKKFNYAMSKLTEIETYFNSSTNLPTQPSNAINSTFIINNFNLVKSLCYINLYSQLENQKSQSNVKQIQGDNLEDNNKQILLSAEELLRHCLITDKQNSLIYYLISAIHYELEQYESSLKYIRQALQYSDDHMIKHYFCKANSKAMLGRYEEAIKDYTNAIIVYKQQVKNDSKQSKQNAKKAKSLRQLRQQNDEEYYQQKQQMINQIYLNRAISYLKYSYKLSRQHRKYSQNSTAISNYRSKAGEDLQKYFKMVLDSKQWSTQKQMKQRLLLLMHTDDPGLILQINKHFQGEFKIINDYDTIKVYYLIKELNNCISHLQSHIVYTEKQMLEKNQLKTKNQTLPPKHKKISAIFAKKNIDSSLQTENINKLKFDLKCLQALKKSSSKSQGALEQSLISLLEITQQIYRKRSEDLHMLSESKQNFTFEQLFDSSCGKIFHWSDILFFIGVINFELREYQTSIKYLQQSYNQKKSNGTLYSLEKYFSPILNKCSHQQEEQEYLFYELEPLFQNRIYCKQQLDYNIGICYLMMKKYKQAYYYLQNYPNFLLLIKKKISGQNYTAKNEFINDSHHKDQILVEEAIQDRSKAQSPQNNVCFKNNSKTNSLKESISAVSQKNSEISSNLQNITPFPIHNRLCSIYSPKIIDDKRFYLSFCLPQVELPLQDLFFKDQIEPGHKYNKDQEMPSTPHSQSSEVRDTDLEDLNNFKIQKKSFQSVIKHITLLDLEMKPIAPWIRQNISGVIFTQNITNQSIQINSERHEKKKDRIEDRKDEQGAKKTKKQRYQSTSEQKKMN